MGNRAVLEEGQVGLWVPAHDPGLGGEELWLGKGRAYGFTWDVLTAEFLALSVNSLPLGKAVPGLSEPVLLRRKSLTSKWPNAFNQQLTWGRGGSSGYHRACALPISQCRLWGNGTEAKDIKLCLPWLRSHWLLLYLIETHSGELGHTLRALSWWTTGHGFGLTFVRSKRFSSPVLPLPPTWNRIFINKCKQSDALWYLLFLTVEKCLIVWITYSRNSSTWAPSALPSLSQWSGPPSGRKACTRLEKITFLGQYLGYGDCSVNAGYCYHE